MDIQKLRALEQILRGGLEKMSEAGCRVIGGHSMGNEDLLFGYAVIHPHCVWRKVCARPGDVLLFTKPLGTAFGKGRANGQSLACAIAAMTTLNSSAAAALHEVEEKSVHAVTNVTGFG